MGTFTVPVRQTQSKERRPCSNRDLVTFSQTQPSGFPQKLSLQWSNISISISVIRSDNLFLQPSGVWKRWHLCGPNWSGKVESKPVATRKITPLYLAPSRLPWLLHLLFHASSHSSTGPNLALSGGGEGISSRAGRDWGKDGACRWWLPYPAPPGPPSKPVSGILADFGNWQCKRVSMAMYQCIEHPP